MLRRLAALVVFAAVLALTGPPLLGAEEGTGARDLALGREALARQDYALAVDHLERAVLTLDPVRDAAVVADVWLQVGIAWLNGLDHPEHALPAFVASAGSAADPSTAWLWASVTAEKLGRTEEALIYRARALSPQTPAPTMSATPAPAPEPAPEPAPAPGPVEAPQEKPDAIQHFFGPKSDEPAPAPEPQQAEENGEPAVEAEAPPQEPPADAVQYFFGPEAVEEPAREVKPAEPAEEKKEKVDAFEHFFGEKEKDEPQEEGEEKPPGR
jgi:tetratricopeptide (TPR) repeat protein